MGKLFNIFNDSLYGWAVSCNDLPLAIIINNGTKSRTNADELVRLANAAPALLEVLRRIEIHQCDVCNGTGMDPDGPPDVCGIGHCESCLGEGERIVGLCPSTVRDAIAQATR